MSQKKTKRFADEYADFKEKNQKMTYEEFLEHRTSILESAIYQVYSDMDELQGVIWMLRNELEKPHAEVNMYHARNALNAIFTLSLKNQSDLMEYSDLDY